jgi:hypothetical protein
MSESRISFSDMKSTTESFSVELETHITKRLSFFYNSEHNLQIYIRKRFDVPWEFAVCLLCTSREVTY